MKFMLIFLLALLWLPASLLAAEEIFEQLSPAEEKKLVAIGSNAAKLVSQRLMKTMLADIKAVGVAEAARGWSKSVGIIKEIADSLNLGMAIRRPTFQYRNPINKPDALDRVALNYFLGAESPDAKYFTRKVTGKNGIHYVYYKPMYVKKKCLLCHSQNMAEDVKAVLNEKYPSDLSGDLSLGALRAAIRVEIPESAL